MDSSQSGHPAASRRVHSAVYNKGKVWVFGGGNGLTPLNDVWTLDVSGGAVLGGARPMRWTEMETTGKRPGARGYNTANLISHRLVFEFGYMNESISLCLDYR